MIGFVSKHILLVPNQQRTNIVVYNSCILVLTKVEEDEVSWYTGACLVEEWQQHICHSQRDASTPHHTAYRPLAVKQIFKSG